MKRVLAISGSLRAQSSNASLLRAVTLLAPAGMEVVTYDGIAALPHFNPDLDTEAPPDVVREWRAALAAADGILISSPEYAHGVPGALKDAFDWIVSSGELMAKPLLLISASPGGAERAHEQLIEILKTMDANVLTDASLRTTQARRFIDADGRVTDPELERTLRNAMQALADAIR
ncbi:MAG TPA: NADPH-dependent FMN reductase [Thermoanaerobaculia bacterium]|nr:NADPH-dependent FMN reductase [Thermoanaerobaculia bacterium]